jgi:DNA-binding NarL/FixJ family response regulator
MKETTTIYIADDHQIIIDGISLLLKNEPGLTICGASTSGMQAMEDIRKIRPDIAIIDLRMPDKDGISIVRSFKGRLATRFLILSMHTDKRFINDAINYGADGYLLKHAGKNEMVAAIHAVLAGEKYFPGPLLNNPEKQAAFLSPREIDIFNLVINGHTSQMIAEKLSLSHYTVDTHRKNILRKTGAKNIAGLLKYAVDHNISFSA